MKKWLSLVAFLIVFVFGAPSVFADGHINYEWGDYFDFRENGYYWQNYIYDVVEKDDGYLIYGSKAVRLYDKNGKVLKENYIDELYCNNVFYDENNNQFLCLSSEYDYDQSKYIYGYKVLDENYKEVKSNASDVDIGDYFLVRNYNDYYVILGEMVVLVKKDLSDFKYFEFEDLTANELKEYLGEYYDFFNINTSNTDSNKYYYSVKSNDTYKAFAFVDDAGKYGVEVYDIDNNLVYKKTYSNITNPIFIELNNDVVYIVVEEDIDDRDLCSQHEHENCSSQLYLYKYDFVKNKTYVEELTELISESFDYGWSVFSGNFVSNMKFIDDKLFVIINYRSIPRGLEEEKTIRQSAVLVYSFTYDIEYKIDGNGEIKAINSSKAGDNVTFTVTPNEGYVLEKVKVTDKNGNTITFTDNTFTMPSNDVIIEASFVPENPDTADIIVCIISFILLISVIYNIIAIKKMDELE